MVNKKSVQDFSLKIQETIQGDRQEYRVMNFPRFIASSYIPPPSQHYWGNGGLIEVDSTMISEDGFLGARWFADKVWKINYGKQSFYYYPVGSIPDTSGFSETSVNFQVNAKRKRTMNFARIAVKIDNRLLDMLFDTGATIELTADATKVFGVAQGTKIGGSYIIHSIFEKWRTLHPDWRIIDFGDSVTGQRHSMIEVPAISIGNLSVGPVWFAVRPDRTFEEWMSSMMDAPIVGAIGGSGLKYFEMILDYPNSKFYFKRNEKPIR